MHSILDPSTRFRLILQIYRRRRTSSLGETVALIPARYPGSESSADDRLKLARRTEWTACGADLFLGYGQRMLTTDTGEYPLLETRRIELAGEPDGQPA